MPVYLYTKQTKIFNIQSLKSSWKPVLTTEIYTKIKYFKVYSHLLTD